MIYLFAAVVVVTMMVRARLGGEISRPLPDPGTVRALIVLYYLCIFCSITTGWQTLEALN